MVRGDSMPLRILGDLAERLPDVEFKEFDPNENLDNEGRGLNIIDSVEGIRKVVLITDINSIKVPKVISMHDFDLGYNLKLLKKLGYIDSVKIFGVPMKIRQKDAIEQLLDLIRATLL